MQNSRFKALKLAKDFYALADKSARMNFALAFGSSLALTGVEFLFSTTLLLFLKILDLMPEGQPLPGPLAKLQLSTTSACLVVLILAATKSGLQILSTLANFKAADNVQQRLRRLAIYELLLRKPSRYVDSGTMNVWFSEIFPKATNGLYGLSQALVGMVQSVGVLFCMFVIAWQEALTATVLMLLIGRIVTNLNKKTRAISFDTTATQKHLIHDLQTIGRSWLLAKIFKTERQEHAKLTNHIKHHSTLLYRGAVLVNFNNNLIPFIGVLMIVLLVFASRMIFGTPAEKFLIFLYLQLRFTQSLSGAANALSISNANYQPIVEAISFFKKFAVREYPLAFAETSIAAEKQAQQIESSLHTLPEVEISDVDFSYDRSVAIFSNLTMVIKSGETLGLVGHSGSGKSTLLGLILGILEPTKGKVLVDGVPSDKFLEEHSIAVGYAGPDPYLFRGSVKQNLIYGLRSEVSEADIYAALDLARMKQVVQSLPKGIEHLIEETGEGLSAGQKQRLSLARALLRKPKLLILDEISANLDDATEAEIVQSIQGLRGKCTTIIVTHREGMLKCCSRVVTMAELTNLSR